MGKSFVIWLGQGWVARELAQRGAQVIGLDLAPNLLGLAQRYEEQEPLGIRYMQGDAQMAEGLHDQQFTGFVCVLALITLADLQATLLSIRRILQPGGWLDFAIPHPYFETPHAQWTSLPDPDHPLGRIVTGYFDERQWFSLNPDGVRSRVGDYHRMLSTYLNQLCTGYLPHLFKKRRIWPSSFVFMMILLERCTT